MTSSAQTDALASRGPSAAPARKRAGATSVPARAGRVRVSAEGRPDNYVIVVFGAAGDLARRKLLPGLFHLAAAGLLPDRYQIIGSSRRSLTDEQFRDLAREAMHRIRHQQAHRGGLADVPAQALVRQCGPRPHRLADRGGRAGGEGDRRHADAAVPPGRPAGRL